jgi:hypothetical protein
LRKQHTLYYLVRVYNIEKITKEFGNRKTINWGKVANKYHGIDIQLVRDCVDDSKYEWYRDWDVSGGCVWHPKAVRKFKLLKLWEKEWQ